MEKVQDLLNNVYIEKFGEPWGIRIVLAAKPHHENIQNIDDFIWRMCFSYRKLNSITKPFKFTITHCDDATSNVGAG